VWIERGKKFDAFLFFLSFSLIATELAFRRRLSVFSFPSTATLKSGLQPPLGQCSPSLPSASSTSPMLLWFFRCPMVPPLPPREYKGCPYLPLLTPVKRLTQITRMPSFPPPLIPLNRKADGNYPLLRHPFPPFLPHKLPTFNITHPPPCTASTIGHTRRLMFNLPSLPNSIITPDFTFFDYFDQIKFRPSPFFPSVAAE